ncbi:MAG: potassium-transporting ATPase subunit KdpA [Opitutaceae bacterium]|nr:potassium-transporting ATPase subunit KdpA [Opitutaceae bacterium]
MSNSSDWLQFATFLGVLALLTKPLGLYLIRVLDPDGRTWLDRAFKPIERMTYRICGIKSDTEQSWLGYTTSLLAFSFVGMLFTYFILRYQNLLPFNPQGMAGLSPHLAFNTAASFTTNTNWQSYSGESTLSYFSQMVALTIHNFTSAATGIGVAAALTRGISRKSARTIGNFWVDMVRVTYYLLLPVCFVFAIVLVSQGVIQNFKPYATAKTLDAISLEVPVLDENGKAVAGNDGRPLLRTKSVDAQILPQGPVASQVPIKLLGTNGGGFFGANAAHPYENPTPFSNFLQMLAILVIPSALTYYFGREVRSQRHGWALWFAMTLLFAGGVCASWWAEASGNPVHHSLGVAASDGNMEGKESRFGIFNSALFATVTTAASCGAVNSMHDSFTPIGGLVPLFNMQTGEVIYGGVGAGLYGILIFALLSVFIAGLMVGRTPEYLGKKIGAFDIKMAVLVLMALSAPLLGLTAWACTSTWGLAGLNNTGPHGFTEILYAFSSAIGNNGSAFAGLAANPSNGDPHYNVTLGFAMLAGRFLMIVPVMAIAGNFASKQPAPMGAGTFNTEGFTFVLLLIGTILLVGALSYLPALAIGPIVEHFLMANGKLF